MLRLAWSHDSANACLAASSITLMYHHSLDRCWTVRPSSADTAGERGSNGAARPRYSDLELHKHWWLLFTSCHKYQGFVLIVVAHVFKLCVSRSSDIMIFPHDRAVTSSAALLTSERHDTALCSTDSVELLTFLCNVGRLPFNYVFVLKQIESLDFQLRRQQM